MKQLVWKKRENKRLIHRALSLIMALSMACTGVLPAMAEGESEKEAASYYCGKEEHIHKDCDSSVLLCQMEEGEEHTHADTCYEVVSCELEDHTHTENCLVELDEQSEE